MAQTHALAYHVEKYDPNEKQLDEQFCTELSTIDNIDNYIIGKRIG